MDTREIEVIKNHRPISHGPFFRRRSIGPLPSCYVQKLFNLGPTFLGDKQFLPKIRSLSKVCPFPDFVQSMSNQEFLYFKNSKYEPWHFFPSPIYVKILSNAKNGNILNFSGQSLDRLWIFMSNLCRKDYEFDIGLTEIWRDLDNSWTNPLHDLFLDWPWTEIWQCLDRGWIFCPVSVQPSNVK